jgi:hypothetical protein
LSEPARRAPFTLARTRLVRGDVGAARATLLDALRVAAELGYPEVPAYCLTLAAELAAPFAPESAVELASAGEAAFERLGIPMQRLEREAHERTVASLGVRLGRRVDRLRERGRALDLDQGAAAVRSLFGEVPGGTSVGQLDRNSHGDSAGVPAGAP